MQQHMQESPEQSLRLSGIQRKQGFRLEAGAAIFQANACPDIRNPGQGSQRTAQLRKQIQKLLPGQFQHLGAQAGFLIGRHREKSRSEKPASSAFRRRSSTKPSVDFREIARLRPSSRSPAVSQS